MERAEWERTETGRQIRRAANKRWREKNKHRHAAYTRSWRERNPLKHLILRVRARARKHGLEFGLTLEYLQTLQVSTHCPVLGIPLKWGTSETKNDPGIISLDRIDSSKGYVEGNVQFMSLRANLLKSNATIEELQKVVDFLRRAPLV